MNVQEKDLVILQASEKKKELVQVTAVDPLRGVICDDNRRDKDLAKHVEFDSDDIVCNFGKKPAYGSAYGITIEYVRSQVEHAPWESVKFFKAHSDTDKSLIFKSLDRTSQALEDHRVFPKERPISVHIKEPKGKYDGYYKAIIRDSSEDQSAHEVMCLKVKDFGNLDYAIYHEVGHGIWSQMMDDDFKARWIKMFTKNISLISDINEKMRNMREELIGIGTTRDFMSDLAEEDGDLFKHILKHIRKQYNIRPLHLNILIAAGDDLTEIRPKRIAAIPQATVLVTEYATEAPEELWCDSFAFHMHPQLQLPKSLQNLMDKTIAAVRYGSNSRGAKLD